MRTCASIVWACGILAAFLYVFDVIDLAAYTVATFTAVLSLIYIATLRSER